MKNTELIKKLKSMNVPRKTSLPSLQNVRIDCNADTLKFTTTDLDTTTSFYVPFIHADFSTIVNHKELVTILASLPKKTEIEFAMIENEFTVISSFGFFPLNTENIESYPSLPNFPTEFNFVNHTISGKLMDIFPFVADNSELRAALTGIYYDSEENILVATNGHILGYLKNIPTLFDSSVIIQGSVPKILKKMKKASIYYGKNSDNEIGFALSGTQIYILGKDFEINSRIVEGKFPPYKKVVPQKNNELLELNPIMVDLIPKELLSYSGQVLLKNDDGKIILHVENMDTNTVWDMEAGTTTLSSDTAFSAKCLKAICKFVGKNPLILQCNNEQSVASLYEDNTKLALIMPIALKENK